MNPTRAATAEPGTTGQAAAGRGTTGPADGPGPEEQEELLGIGAAAAAAGVSERALRYYQQLGLIVPSGTTPGGLRRYSAENLARVARIRELQTLLGLNLDEIAVVLRNEDRMAQIRRAYRDERTSDDERLGLTRECLARFGPQPDPQEPPSVLPRAAASGRVPGQRRRIRSRMARLTWTRLARAGSPAARSMTAASRCSSRWRAVAVPQRQFSSGSRNRWGDPPRSARSTSASPRMSQPAQASARLPSRPEPVSDRQVDR